jgi:Arc/MetJ-type ribon-helix-helix transcriptional regulator
MGKIVTISLPEPEYRALEYLRGERRDANRSAVVREFLNECMTERYGAEWFRRFEDEADREDVA